MNNMKRFKVQTSARDDTKSTGAGYAKYLKAFMLITMSGALFTTNASGKIKPASSGDSSYYEPAMVKHGSRFKHP